MRRFRFLGIILTGIFFCFAEAEAATKLLRGVHSITYDIINPKGLCSIPNYSNDGFEQKVIAEDSFSKKLKVTVKLDTFKSRASFPIPNSIIGRDLRAFLKSEERIQSDNHLIRSYARDITRDAKTVKEAFDRIINWVMDRLTYKIETPQDAYSVLINKLGSCQGYSNLSVALLRSAGIPARLVYGYLPPGDIWGATKVYWDVEIQEGGPHAWIEVYFPDVGWVSTDAERSKNFVDPFHIVLAIIGTDIKSDCYAGGKVLIDFKEMTSFTIAEEVNEVESLDEVDEPQKPMLERVAIGDTFRGRILARITDTSGKPIKGAEAILWKGLSGDVLPASNSGDVQLVGLEPGVYNVTFRAGGYAKDERGISLEKGETKKIDIMLSPGGKITGRVMSKGGKPVAGADVVLWEGRRGSVHQVKNDGSFIIDYLTPGKYQLSARAEGYKEKFVEKEVKKSEAVNIDFILEVSR
ncbi:MAG: transglutaminase domain-containing protein [Deltaproteobacteria bacterium]|nr:MAG: transglutaminase domain-containing protein [Deltaproteobacteria bacterium]